jgi:hypothetical protein
LSIEDFVNKYEKENLPVIIENIPEYEGWQAATNWSLDALKAKYNNLRMRCGDDDDGYTLKVKEHLLRLRRC